MKHCHYYQYALTLVFLTSSPFPSVAPLLTPGSMDVEVEVGTQLTLSVNVTEFNLPIDDVMWMMDGGVIENGTDGYTIEFIDLDAPPSMVVLTLDEVSSPVSDNGQYILSVSNPAGMDTSTFNVTVSGESRRLYIKHINFKV